MAASAVQTALFFCVAGVVCVANDGKDSAGETGRLTIFWYFLARGRRDVSRRRGFLAPVRIKPERCPLNTSGIIRVACFFLARVLREAARGFAAAWGFAVAAGCGCGGECRASRLVFCVAGVVCVANDGKDSAGETGRLTIFWYFFARGFCAGAARCFAAARGLQWRRRFLAPVRIKPERCPLNTSGIIKACMFFLARVLREAARDFAAARGFAVAAGCGGGGECRANRLVFFVSLVLYVLRMTARTPLVRRGGCQSFGIFLRGVFARGQRDVSRRRGGYSGGGLRRRRRVPCKPPCFLCRWCCMCCE